MEITVVGRAEYQRVRCLTLIDNGKAEQREYAIRCRRIRNEFAEMNEG